MRTVLITGGSSGIGLAVAKRLARTPHRLLILGRSRSRLETAKVEIKAIACQETDIVTIAADITNIEEITGELAPWINQLGVVIHCAGAGLAKSFEDTSMEEFHKIVDINLIGTMNLSKVIVPAMKQRGSGRIFFVSSVAGLLGIYGYTAYSASKFAIEGFAQALRNELTGTGIQLSLVYPPDVDTPMLAEENLTKPAITRKISGNVLLSPERVAEEIVRNISRKSFRIIPGFRNRLSCMVIIHLPGLVFSLIDRWARKRV